MVTFSLYYRWGWLLLQSFHSQLSHKALKAVTDSITEAADHFRLELGHAVQAPFPLTSVPRIAVFKPQPLTPLLTAKQSVTLFPSLLHSSISEVHFMTVIALHPFLLFVCTCSSVTFSASYSKKYVLYIYNKNTDVSVFYDLYCIFSKGPFLVSRIGKNRMKESDILWVQGDPAEALLMVSNPLSMELKVEKMVGYQNVHT